MTAGRRTLPTVLSAVLVVSLAGCASETERYCDTLAEEKQTLTDLAASGTGEGDVLARTAEVFRDLHEAAPSDVEDEWATVENAYEVLADAFADAGVEPAEYNPASPPEDVTDAQAAKIEDAAAELRSARVMDAAKGLEQHSRDVCKVDLGLSSG
jgi:hypothetical protein